jgi:hypothetical protein
VIDLAVFSDLLESPYLQESPIWPAAFLRFPMAVPGVF